MVMRTTGSQPTTTFRLCHQAPFGSTRTTRVRPRPSHPRPPSLGPSFDSRFAAIKPNRRTCAALAKKRTFGADGQGDGKGQIADIWLRGRSRQKPSTSSPVSAEALRQDGTINPRLGWLRGRAPRDGAVSYVRGKFGRSARAFSRPIAPSSAADKPSSFMRRAVSFSGTNGLSLPNKI